MRIFPPRFDPKAFDGPRASQFENRSDAFQQLVGDGLREEHGVSASVTTTSGPDGAIDGWVAGGAFSLPGPTIIECKDHDEKSGRLWHNVLAGWREVAAKLTKQAELGWPQRFAPWKEARSYAYSISAVIPDQEKRRDLQQRIEGFFCGLGEGAPPVEAVQVLDWSDLRAWLDSQPRTRDAWLGLEDPFIVPHREFRDGLTGFRRLLLEEELPYVEPAQEDPLHPAVLLRKIGHRAGRGGVLVVGPGGVGKTRLAMEIADRAHRQRWRVLNVLPGEPGPDFESLRRSVLTTPSEPGNQGTLLLMDYVDRLEQLDLGAILRNLIPQATGRGIRLALLANCRPGWLQKENVGRDALFETLELRPTEHYSVAITRQILSSVAPSALARFGVTDLERVCGHRPIVAMFIARELEHRNTLDELDAKLLAEARPEDLLTWLRMRLTEDKINVEVGRGLRAPEPGPEVTAAAAVLAAAPQSRPALELVAQSCLQDHQPLPSTPGSYVVALLERLGWLEARGGELSAAHDIVADEVLEQTTRLKPSDDVRVEALRRILLPAVGSSRTLGRFATSLSRLMAQKGGFPANLEAAASDWLDDYAGEIGTALPSRDPSETSYALAAVVSGRPWRDRATERWGELVQPWLEKHAESVEARHLLYRGLKKLSAPGELGLVAQGLRWLGRHGDSAEASFVLAPLLAHDELKGEPASQAIQSALQWLQHEENGLALDAGFILKPLLARANIEGEPASFDYARARVQAIRAAGTWLEANPEDEAREYVQNRALRLIGAPIRDWIGIADRTLSWLAETAHTEDRDFTYNSLLVRPELLDPDRMDWLARDILTWVGGVGGEQDAKVAARLKVKLGRLLRASAVNEHSETTSKADVVPLEFKLQAALFRLAHHRPPQALLLQGMSRLEELIRRSSIQETLALVPPLIPLCLTTGQTDTRQRLQAAVGDLLAEESELGRFRPALLKASEELMAFWPSYEEARLALAELGIR